MKRLAAIMLTSLAILLATAAVVGAQVDIRGTVATGTNTWTADNFAGFYYDIDDNIKTESLTATVTDGNKLSGDQVDGVRGVQYTTTAQKDDFDFADWGSYNVIGFLAEKYFAGYIETPDSENDILFTESTDENVLSDEQLLKILVDDDTERTVTSGTPLALMEGYELGIKSIDIDGNKVYLELTKDGEVIDSKVISPSADNADMADKTYFYKADVGDSSDVVLVAVHFKNAFRGADTNLATVDGVWQLSDTPVDVAENTEYDKMTIESVTADTIVMENEDNDITLSKNKDISLMPGVSFKTADADELRYYIYKEAVIEGAEEPAAAEEAAVTEEATPAAEAAAAAAVAEERAAEARENVTVEEAAAEEAAATAEEAAAEEAAAEEAAPAAENATAEAQPSQPGFEGIFAITGLLAVAYLVLGRKQ
jgi:S-layer protein (TIGR01567 family)